MDPRLYTYQRRTPRLMNPTFKSQFVGDALHVFKGGPLDSTPMKKDKITQIPYRQENKDPLKYSPPDISKIRASFQNNRSKVPLSNLSAYARQIMFPTQTNISKNENPYSKEGCYDKFFKKQLFLDNKQTNYIKQYLSMNSQFLQKSRLNKSVDLKSNTDRQAAGRRSIIYDDKDKRYYRYKHSYDRQIQIKNSQISNSNTNQSSTYKKQNSQIMSNSEKKGYFLPSRLNYADQMKGII